MIFFFPYRHEYQIFQKILKLEYDFPDGFNIDARNIVEKLLVSMEQCSQYLHYLTFPYKLYF